VDDIVAGRTDDTLGWKTPANTSISNVKPITAPPMAPVQTMTGGIFLGSNFDIFYPLPS
jgi:hypothetical protein